jgi:hypothetical protein
VETWHDLDVGRPIAAPLERCAELLGVDLATVRELAAKVEPYLRADGTKIWSLLQLERQLRPEAYGRRRGGYLDRRRIQSAALGGTTRGPSGEPTSPRTLLGRSWMRSLPVACWCLPSSGGFPRRAHACQHT